jgi:transcriptional regulator with XRE-family HTH domain
MGWTRKSAGVSVLLAMEEHRRQAGARVLQLREARNWTHEDLAHAAGLSVKTVSRYERGRVEGRRTTTRKLAEALGVDEHDIIGQPPAPLGLGHAQNGSEGSELVEEVKLLAERVGTLEQVIADFGELLEARLPAAAPRRRRSSGS